MNSWGDDQRISATIELNKSANVNRLTGDFTQSCILYNNIIYIIIYILYI